MLINFVTVAYMRDRTVLGGVHFLVYGVCGQVSSYLIRIMFQEIYRVHTTDVGFSVLAANKLKGD